MAAIRFHSSGENPPAGAAACCAGRGFALRREPLDRGRELLLPEDVLDDSEEHADAGAREPGMPVHFLREVPGDDRAEEGAEVDAHVENGEPRVPAVIARLVERSDEDRNVRLQKAGADDDQREPGVERREHLEREREMPHRDDDPSGEDAPVLAEQAVRNEAAEDRREPDASGVRAVEGARVPVVEAEPPGGDRGDHVEDEERPHSVVAEPFPHFREEQDRQARGVFRLDG